MKILSILLMLALFVGNSFAESYSYEFSPKPKNITEIKGVEEGIFSLLPKCEDIKIWKNCFGEKFIDSGEEGFYLGEWKDNKTRHGKGRFISASGSYIGDWKNNKRHGKGTFESTSPKEKYTGDWNNDKRHGQGVLTAYRGSYDGEWKDNLKHGFGTLISSNGVKYTGQFKNDSPSDMDAYYRAMDLNPNLNQYKKDKASSKKEVNFNKECWMLVPKNSECPSRCMDSKWVKENDPPECKNYNKTKLFLSCEVVDKGRTKLEIYDNGYSAFDFGNTTLITKRNIFKRVPDKEKYPIYLDIENKSVSIEASGDLEDSYRNVSFSGKLTTETESSFYIEAERRLGEKWEININRNTGTINIKPKGFIGILDAINRLDNDRPIRILEGYCEARPKRKF